MTEHAITDEVAVRFGIGGAVLFLLTGVMVASRLPGGYGVAVLFLATVVLAAPLNRRYALGLGAAGWAFATGFAVNTLGVLTVAPPDLLRLAAFMGAAAMTGRLGDAP